MAECVRTTLFVGNLDSRVDERLLYELFLQSSPVVRVHIPRDKGSATHKGYGFVELPSAECAEYARALLDGCVRLYGREIRIRNSGADKGKDRPGATQGADEAQGQMPGAAGMAPGTGPLFNPFSDGGVAATQRLFEMQLRQRLSMQQAAQMGGLGVPGAAMGALSLHPNRGACGTLLWIQQQQQQQANGLLQRPQTLAPPAGMLSQSMAFPQSQPRSLPHQQLLQQQMLLQQRMLQQQQLYRSAWQH